MLNPAEVFRISQAASPLGSGGWGTGGQVLWWEELVNFCPASWDITSEQRICYMDKVGHIGSIMWMIMHEENT